MYIIILRNKDIFRNNKFRKVSLFFIYIVIRQQNNIKEEKNI